jgi:hypothetical protein
MHLYIEDLYSYIEMDLEKSELVPSVEKIIRDMGYNVRSICFFDIPGRCRTGFLINEMNPYILPEFLEDLEKKMKNMKYKLFPHVIPFTFKGKVRIQKNFL